MKDKDIKFPLIYRGLVKDVNDPLKQGRVKVQVYPMFAEIPVAVLPWAVPAFPLSSGAGEGFGSFAVPNVESYVYVFFLMGDVYQPVYFAEAATATIGIPAFGLSGPTKRGFTTYAGFSFILDDVAKTMTIIHPGGTTIVIASDGAINISANGAVSVASAGDVTVSAVNADVIAAAGATVKAGGAASVEALGLLTIKGGTAVRINP